MLAFFVGLALGVGPHYPHTIDCRASSVRRRSSHLCHFPAVNWAQTVSAPAPRFLAHTSFFPPPTTLPLLQMTPGWTVKNTCNLEGDFSAINARTLPSWYADMKFGIFIHWGIYSVPSFVSVFLFLFLLLLPYSLLLLLPLSYM